MKSSIQKKLLHQLLTDGNCDPAAILGVLTRQLFSDSRLQQVFLACRNSFRVRGCISLKYVKGWLQANADNESERADFADLLAELTEGNGLNN